MRTPGLQFFNDSARRRFVVYQTRGGKVFKTSIRYNGGTRTKVQAQTLARMKARELLSGKTAGK